MPKYPLKAMLVVLATAFALVGCAGAGSSAYVFCGKTQPVSGCKTVSSSMKCLPQDGYPGGARIKCK
jgi:hypothetical protein